MGVKQKRAARYGLAPSAGLWWFTRLEPAERDAVISAYIKQYSRGRSLPEEFREDLETWLRELSARVPGRLRHTCKYWTLPGYAQHVRVSAPTLMKRCRRLEQIAMELYPEKIEPSRDPLRVDAIIAFQLEIIRERYKECGDATVVAREFDIEPWRVGQLCKDLKDAAKAGREAETQTSISGTPSDDDVL